MVIKYDKMGYMDILALFFVAHLCLKMCAPLTPVVIAFFASNKHIES